MNPTQDHPVSGGPLARPDPDAPSITLDALGWGAPFEQTFAPIGQQGLVPGRVAVADRSGYRVYTARGELEAQVSGRFRFEASGPGDHPVVGDWVTLRSRATERRATIQAVLPRRTHFSRRAAGDATEQQVLAANVDTVFLVMALDRDFNPRRLERYLVLGWESGAQPAIVLSKSDLAEGLAEKLGAVAALAPGVPVHAVSAADGTGVGELAIYLGRGRTAALLGSSGVGKSTLINRLVGRQVARTGAVRVGDGRGRHTTTRRELVMLPGGGLLIDTPGLRELQLWEAADGHRTAFHDVETVAAACRFRDCTHHDEPGCAVAAALADGAIEAERFASYEKLRRELAHLETRVDKRARLEQKRSHRAIHRAMRDHRPRT